MPSFTFESGNAAGLRRLPLYVLGALATLLVPRSPRLWVYGCGIGPGEGALPLLRLAQVQLPAARHVWLATTDNELARARELGFDAVAKLSWRGWWLTTRARVLVVTHGLGDVNRYGARGGFVVQLWHGIPLKRLHLDAPVAQAANSRLGRLVVRRGYRAVGRQIDLFPVASEPVVDRVVSAFGVRRDAVAVTGDPRDDVLLLGDDATRRAAARRLLVDALGPLPGAGPVVMYAPTWRDGAPDPGVPSDADWAAIATWLDRVDGTLIVRNHPLGRADYAAGPATSKRVRLLEAATLADLTPALPGVDHLVTDYSSAAFDFALIDGTSVYLAADLGRYLESRGFYEPYREFSGGQHVQDWPAALRQLDELVDPTSEAASQARAHARRVRDDHFDHLDGKSTERVLAEIRRRLDGASEAAASADGADGVDGGSHSRPVVRALEIGETELRVELDRPVGRASLDGPRQRVAADVAAADVNGTDVDGTDVDGTDVNGTDVNGTDVNGTDVDGTKADGTVLRFPLLVTRWGVPDLALPAGRYRLRIDDSHRTQVAVDPLPAVLCPLFRASAHAVDGGVELRIAAPLTDDEREPATQRALRLAALRPRRRRERAVYFESFYSRSASDNPAAIDRVLAREMPDVRRYWSVGDRSVAVPDGGVPLVEYSREWWRVRAEARVYVVNDWLRWTHRRRRRQRVLQTWHGTMLKRLALDRAEHTPRQRFAAVRQSLRWNVLLAQNDYSARIFRSAYAFRGPIWTTGYPRNDVFADPARAAHVRAIVGIPEGMRAVLYAPTWRDDRTELVDYLDLSGFADALPDGHVLLVRGHSRTLGYGEDLRGARLIDMTSYPDVADLMLVADVLVTDYSSVMFDFAATGKPMVFYAPDLAHYGDVVRGFYFDLLADAPGPVVETRADLLAAIVDAPADVEKHAERYAAWRAKFAPHDDGRAAERVVRRMIDEGWFS